MKFLTDMGVARSTVEWLRLRGYDAVRLREQGLQRLPDSDIFAKARAEERVVLTFDLDFGEIAAAAGTALPSVIIFRLQDERPVNVDQRLAIVLREAAEDLEAGAIISVDEYRYRVRRLPISPDLGSAKP